MSLLPQIANSWAFSERPIEFYEISELYIPFNEISHDNPESILEILGKDNYFFLIEGPRGVGKSCFIRYLASNLYFSETFTILLNSFGNSDYADPNTLAKWMIDAISKAVEIYLSIPGETKEYISKLMAKEVQLVKSTESKIGTKFGGWLNIIPQILRFEANVSVDIKEVADSHIKKEYFLTDRVRCIDDFLENITEKGGFTSSVILFDGIDHMNLDKINEFASNNFPWLTQINASVILTSLTKYRENAGYEELSKRARVLRIPRIDSEFSLMKLLDKRVNALEEGKKWEDACETEATKLLFEWYRSRPDKLPLRKLIRSVNYAANSAIEEGKEKIKPYHISMGLKEAI